MNKELFAQQLVQYFNDHVELTGDGRFTSFDKHMKELMKEHVKPLTARSGMKSGDGGWRDEVKSRFSGRGMKWFKVAIDVVMPTIERLQGEDIDCDQYLKWIDRAGFAWIRYDAPRVHDGKQCAAFHVKVDGSKSTDSEKSRYHCYITTGSLDEVITSLGGTPHFMKLEVEEEVLVSDEEPVNDEVVSDEKVEIKEEVETEEVIDEVVEEEEEEDIFAV
jgi:hypothetical protein